MENIYQYFMETADDFIAVLDTNFKIVLLNNTYLKILKKRKEELLGKDILDIWGQSREQSHLYNYLQQCLRGEQVSFIDTHYLNDTVYKLQVSCYPFLQDGQVTHLITVLHNVSDRNKLAQQLTHYEFRDPVTGLFNRRSLEIILDMELEKASRSSSDGQRALFFISINNLGNVNEVLGFKTGDILLENIGYRIKESLRKSDYIFRFEGNQLAVLLTNFARKTDLALVAEKISEQVRMPYYSETADIHLKSWIGISSFPGDSENVDDFIKHAASARSEARKQNKDYLFWDKELQEVSLERLKMRNELTRAFRNDEFVLHYQPVVNSKGCIVGGEALVRWNHPQKGLLAPGKFIDILEENNAISHLTHWVIFKVASRLKKFLEHRELFISINLSARDFEVAHLPEIIQNATKCGIPPEKLKFEITESACVQDVEKSLQIMETLKRYKHELLIDDFGTGQSSLGYLYRIPADLLKIDKLFVDDIAVDPDKFNYLKDIVALIRNRGKDLLIEGVATKDQFDLLLKLDCQYFQGFYFSEPVNEDLFEKFIKEDVTLPLTKRLT